MWCVTEDSTELGDFVTQLRGYLGLLGRGVELLAALASVVVDVDVEGARHRARGALDDRPVVAGAPAHRHVLLIGPTDQLAGFGSVVQRRGELDVRAAGGAEIGRGGEQERER